MARCTRMYTQTVLRRTLLAALCTTTLGSAALAEAATLAAYSFDDAANTVVVDGYTVFDLRAAYQLRENLELYGRLENAFDEEYETIARYGTPGRGFFVGVRQSF